MSIENKFTCDLTPPDPEQKYFTGSKNPYQITEYTSGWKLVHKLIFYPELLRQNISELNINDVDSKGNTPLHLAIANELPISTIELLLSHGAEPFKETVDGVCSTHYLLAMLGHDVSSYVRLIVKYINKYPTIDELTGVFGMLNWNPRILQFLELLLIKCKPNLKDPNIVSEYLSDLEIMVEKQMVTQEDQIVKYLSLLIRYQLDIKTDNIKLSDLITVFIDKNFLKCIKFIYQSGANPNLIASDGLLVLGYACQVRNKEVVKILLNLGANLEIAGMGGIGGTPLETARNFFWENTPEAQADYIQIIKMLIEAGAEFEDKLPEDCIIWKRLYLLSLEEQKVKDRRIMDLKVLHGFGDKAIIKNIIGSYL